MSGGQFPRLCMKLNLYNLKLASQGCQIHLKLDGVLTSIFFLHILLTSQKVSLNWQLVSTPYSGNNFNFVVTPAFL